MLAQNVTSWRKPSIFVPSPAKRPVSPPCVKRQRSLSALIFAPYFKKPTAYLDCFHSPLFTLEAFSIAYQTSILCRTNLLWVWSFPVFHNASVFWDLHFSQHALPQKPSLPTVPFSSPKFTSPDYFQSFCTLLFLSNFLSIYAFFKDQPPYPPPLVLLPLPKYLHCYCQLSTLQFPFLFPHKSLFPSSNSFSFPIPLYLCDLCPFPESFQPACIVNQGIRTLW